MSTAHIISTTVWILATLLLLDFICSVRAELCPSGIECDYHEHCCESGCCSDNYNYTYGYGFYNLWYFWFVIIMIMMTCCGACSYVKKRQYYMRQQQDMLRANPGAGTNTLHQPPATYGVHPGTHPGTMAPPVGTFPGPPAYNEVTGKPDQFPKAEFGYPNYGFAAPPHYSPYESSSMPPQTAAAPLPEGTIPVHTTTADGTIPTQYPPSAAMAYPPVTTGLPSTPYPPAATPDSVPTSAPPPYSSSETSPAVLPTDHSSPVA